MKKVKLRPYGFNSVVSTYDETYKSDEINDFMNGTVFGIRFTLIALFGWTIDYDSDSVIRIRNRKGKVIYEENGRR